MSRITERAHAAVRAVLQPGDRAVDATVGNGHDTLFLARCVGAGGEVVGFDVQQAALDETRRRLAAAGVAGGTVRLVRAGHETMAEHVRGPVAAVMFNLGYLPGGDHALTTRADTTLAALDQALGLLPPGGIITVVCYRGHPGGAGEAEAVCRWARGLDDVTVDVGGRDETEAGPLLVVVRRYLTL